MPGLIAGAVDLFAGGGAVLSDLFGLGGAGAAAAAPALGAAEATIPTALEAGAGESAFGPLSALFGGSAPTALPAGGTADLASALTGASWTGGTATPLLDASGISAFAGTGAPGALDTSALGFADPITSGIAPGADASSALGLQAPSAATGAPAANAIDAALGTGNVGTAAGDTGGLTAGAAGGTGGATPGGSANILQQLTSDPLGTLGKGAAQSIVNNPLGIGLGAAGLGYALATGAKGSPINTAQGVALQEEAAQANALGTQLQSYLTSGTLPPAIQTQVTEATKAAKETIIARYAQQGLSTDPKQNSTLAQELAQVDTNAIAGTAQIAQNLMTTGMSETGLASNLYQFLLSTNAAQQNQLMTSIANFASAFGSKGPTIQLGSGSSNVVQPVSSTVH